MNTVHNKDRLEISLSQMESAAINYALRNINDNKVRKGYLTQTHKLILEYRAKVAEGELSRAEATSEIQSIRNDIIEVTLQRSSQIGKIKVISLKASGLVLDDLTTKYAKDQLGSLVRNCLGSSIAYGA